jgi:argininosuccinate lyase
MPQKKNPDVAELIRGKTGRVYGSLVSLLTLLKGLPLSYNRDLQEDKEALFDCVETLRSCLGIFTAMLPKLKVLEQNMKTAAQQGYTTATDLADYLTAKGIPFRSAHEIVGRIVAYAIREKKALHDMTLKELQSFSPAIAADALTCLTVEYSVNSRAVRGGTAPQTVKKAINKAWNDLQKQRKTRAAAKPVLRNK